MNTEKINEQLLLELRKFKETGDLSDVLKSLFYQISKKTIDSDRYKFLNDDLRFTCVLNACKACEKQRFNPEKSSNAYMYIKTIVRSSISSTIVKMNKNIL